MRKTMLAGIAMLALTGTAHAQMGPPQMVPGAPGQPSNDHNVSITLPLDTVNLIAAYFKRHAQDPNASAAETHDAQTTLFLLQALIAPQLEDKANHLPQGDKPDPNASKDDRHGKTQEPGPNKGNALDHVLPNEDGNPVKIPDLGAASPLPAKAGRPDPEPVVEPAAPSDPASVQAPPAVNLTPPSP